MARLPTSASRPRSACAWPTKMTMTPAKAISEAPMILRADLLLRTSGGEIEGDERRDERQRDGLGNRHARQAPEEEDRHPRASDAAREVDAHGRPRPASAGWAANKAPAIAVPARLRQNMVV